MVCAAAVSHQMGYNMTIVRHGGGGGRPGGKPTFNWREKQQLRLVQKQAKKELKVLPFGSFLDLAPFFDEKDGDKIFDPTKTPNFTIEARQGADDPDNNTKKLISFPLLFGSNKSYGLLREKANKGRARFSHKRIFGQGKAPMVEATATDS
jgi:hypothetical protein